MYEQKLPKSQIYVGSVHKYHKFYSQLTWPFYGFNSTVWAKTSKILFVREFSAQVSQMVFSAPLTVLRFSTTVRGETSKISYLLEFSAEVSEIVFSAYLTILQLFITL